MTTSPRFALNHMSVPQLDLPSFFALAAGLGAQAVEIRNDLAGNAILDGTPPEAVRREAERHGLRIRSINALQKFNRWNEERAVEAAELANYAAACGAEALVLVPVNDGSGRGEAERHDNLRGALKALTPILKERGLTGLVEPLGFESCSLRSKREAVEAIAAIGASDVFRIVHDTFHHHLASEPDLFAGQTGLVHISGVDESGLAVSDMRDEHRVLVGGEDRLGNAGQMQALMRAGYDGLFSFEAFAPAVHRLADPKSALGDSMAFLRDHAVAAAA